MDNQDEGVMHDVVVYAPGSGSVGSTALLPGPAIASFTFTPSVAGTYSFKCSAHPFQMTGTVTVQ
jgi:plastocyanin